MFGCEATFEFGPFRMEPHERRLLRHGTPVPLTAKTFDTLLTLVRKHGTLVTKQQLLSAVWPGVIVGESNLTFTISILRKALGEGRTGQRYIETVPKQGYRFVARVNKLMPRPQHSTESWEPSKLAWIVERDRELSSLLAALRLAQFGRPQARFLAGEPGVGKTTLINLFAAQLDRDRDVLCARGSCIDHKSGSEPYLPLLEALDSLARGECRELLAQVLRVHAPTWMAKMPSLQNSAAPVLAGQSAERMLREIEGAVVELGRSKTLILVLEDLQWSDYSTVDFVARMVRFVASARFLLIGTWRPADAKSRAHPSHPLIEELCFRCPECLIPVGLLSREATKEFVARRFNPQLADTLAPILYSRTDGNPLFMNALIHSWQEDKSLRRENSQWYLDADSVSAEIPETLGGFIDLQTATLAPEQREVLEAASVARPHAWLRVIAAALDRPIDHVERVCVTLAWTGQMLQRAAKFDYPNGEPGQAFEFTHGLYAEVIYSRIPAARCVRLHQRVADFLERMFASNPALIAGSLAAHFRAGRDQRRAIHYLTIAAKCASGNGAVADAIVHLNEALDMIPCLPDAKDRELAELEVQSAQASFSLDLEGKDLSIGNASDLG